MTLPILATLLALAPAWLPRQASAADAPEARPEGRTHYMGREIARTMHWSGARWLLRETREDEENGVLLRDWLAVQPGSTVCDLGCGNGYHTLPLAREVGAEGRVLAVDLQERMLELLRGRLAVAEIENVERIHGAADDPKLPPGSCDLVLMVDVYHELSHPVRVLDHVRRALKPGGRLVLVEFRAEDPEVPIKRRHKMSKAQVLNELATNGFGLADEYDGLPWQHALSFSVVPEGARSERRVVAEVAAGFWRALTAGESEWAGAFLADRLDEWYGDPCSHQVAVSGLHTAVASDPVAWTEALGSWRTSLAWGRDGAALLLAGPDGSPDDRFRLEPDAEGRWIVTAATQSAALGPLVAMHTATGEDPVADQAALVDRLGYGGLAWHLEGVAEVRAECEARGMDLWSVYAVLDVAGEADPLEERVAAALSALDGGPAQLWLGLRSSAHAPSDPAGDAAALAVLRRVLSVADQHAVEVALYPHHGFWLERSEDALRLLEALDHPYAGLCFNLCHWLRNHGPADPGWLLGRAGERLFAVTVSGADRDGADWASLIRPLDEGTYELANLLTILDGLGFAGPVGLQGYGIQLPPREQLERSMAAWRAMRVDDPR